MTIIQLEYFTEICRVMNFTKAAENLNISQTAVSKQIHLLESELGAELFDRSQKKIRLTSSGEFFLAEAKGALSHFHNIEYNMQAFLKGECGALRLGILRNFIPRTLVACISIFQMKYPKLEISIFCGGKDELYQKLNSGELDCVIAQPRCEDEYEAIPITDFYPVVVMNKIDPLAGKKKLYDKDLSSLLYDARSSDEHPNLDEIFLKISCFGGYAVVYEYNQTSAYDKYLSVVPLETRRFQNISFVYRKNSSSRVLKSFADFARSTYR